MVVKTAELRSFRVQESNRYVSTPINDHLMKRVAEFWDHAQDCLAGGGTRRRLFAVIGESGTGKSTAINHILSTVADYQRYHDDHGDQRIPVVSYEVQRTNTNKDLAIHLLRELGQTGSPKATEDALYTELKTQLRAAGTVLLHLDEAQHLQKSRTSAAVQGMQDRFKSLLSVPDWPLHLLISGVDELAELFTGDQQLANRSVIMRFDKLLYPGDKGFVEEILRDIAVVHCELQLQPSIMTADFIGRLVQATGGCVGTMIEMVQAACFKALSRDSATLVPKDFEFVYGRISGSLDQDNIIKASSWTDLERKNALIDLVSPTANNLVPRKRGSKKGGK